MEMYFDIPTQVKFYDRDDDNWLGGIAYGSIIICGECGSVIEISELEPSELEELGGWISVSEKIMGE